MTTTETTWIGDNPTERVISFVPPDILHAIEAFEAAKVRRYQWNRQHVLDHEHLSLDRCQAYTRLMEQWWGRLRALLPIEAGWYPHGGYVYGYAKRDGGGLKLVREPGCSRWPDPKKARSYDFVTSRRREEEARARAFFAAYSGARGHGRQDRPELTV